MALSFTDPPVDRKDNEPVATRLLGGTPPGIAPGYVLNAGEGPAWWFQGMLVTMKARKVDTDGAFSLLEFYGPRGAWAPGHIHDQELEAFFMLEGALDVGIGTEIFRNVGQGAYFYVPKKTVHEWRIVSASARFLCWVAPGGFEHFFEERCQSAQSPTYPIGEHYNMPREEVAKIAPGYGWTRAPGALELEAAKASAASGKGGA